MKKRLITFLIRLASVNCRATTQRDEASGKRAEVFKRSEDIAALKLYNGGRGV